MKKYILLCLFFIPFASCKDFLEEKQVSTLTQDFYKTEAGLDGLIRGLYVYARVKHEWDANGARLIETETDAYMSANIDWARVNSLHYGSDISSISNNVNNYIGGANDVYAPMGAYPHINNCNIALDIMETVRPGRFGTDELYASNRKAEILFLRAWAYYLISNQLGAVPLQLTARYEDNGIYYYPKAPLADIYDQIISDLQFAYNNLPASQGERGRATKWAAGHLLAKLYLNRAQAFDFQNSGRTHLEMLYKGGNKAVDLDSAISIATEVINGVGGLAPDYAMLFDPKISETAPHKEVLWIAQFDVNTSLNGRFQNRSVNYHIGDYTANTGVTRSQAYGRPFGVFKPTDWGYDNFRDKVNDSRFYKTFQYEYISNMPSLSSSTSFTWSQPAANWWNANKPAGEPAVTVNSKRILNGKRALIYLENQQSEALDSAMVLSMPFQFMVRWIKSAKTGNYYYRIWHDAKTGMGLATQRVPPYLSSRKWVDPLKGGSADEGNFNSESGTRDMILMRLAETYMIRAEAYGRKGLFSEAVNDINVLRRRAAYKPGESRPAVQVQYEPRAVSIPANEKVFPYLVSASTENAILVSENHFTPGMPEAIAEGYIPTVSTKEDMFIHFIYNEKAREFLSEGIAWEDLHNAGILYERVNYLNQMASNLRSVMWPVATNTENGNGQNGVGKGQFLEIHTFRPWPNAYLSLLTDENGKPLTEEQSAHYQNPGY
jgi:hypothetical protein